MRFSGDSRTPTARGDVETPQLVENAEGVRVGVALCTPGLRLVWRNPELARTGFERQRGNLPPYPPSFRKAGFGRSITTCALFSANDGGTPKLHQCRPDFSGQRASEALNVVPRCGSRALTACSAAGRLPWSPPWTRKCLLSGDDGRLSHGGLLGSLFPRKRLGDLTRFGFTVPAAFAGFLLWCALRSLQTPDPRTLSMSPAWIFRISGMSEGKAGNPKSIAEFMGHRLLTGSMFWRRYLSWRIQSWYRQLWEIWAYRIFPTPDYPQMRVSKGRKNPRLGVGGHRMTPRRILNGRSTPRWQARQAAEVIRSGVETRRAEREAPVLAMPPAVDSWGRPRNPQPRKVAGSVERLTA